MALFSCCCYLQTVIKVIIVIIIFVFILSKSALVDGPVCHSVQSMALVSFEGGWQNAWRLVEDIYEQFTVKRFVHFKQLHSVTCGTGIVSAQHHSYHTHFSWSAVRARHALVAEVGLSAVRPVTVCVEVVRARPWREFQNVHALSLNSCAQFAHSLRTVNEVTRKCYYKCRRDKWWHLGNFFWTFQISRHDIARTISPDPHSHAHCHEFFPHCHEPFIAPVSGLFM